MDFSARVFGSSAENDPVRARPWVKADSVKLGELSNIQI